MKLMFSPAKKRPDEVRTAPGERVYAIGDVHGRLDLLRKLMGRIFEDMSRGTDTTKNMRIIFLGDLIDRGPDSKDCLQYVQGYMHDHGAELILGNHEELFLRSIKGDPQAQELWLKHGGLDTLRSFDVAPLEEGEDSFDFGERLSKQVNPELLEMLEAAPTTLRSGDYLFAHAGVRPGVSLKNQEDFDLFFIREEFTKSKRWHGAMIVHGHTIEESVRIYPNRIAVDTGAFRTGLLSAIRLQGLDQMVLDTADIDESIIIPEEMDAAPSVTKSTELEPPL